MSTTNRYSMRLRARGNDEGNADNDVASRTALGNLSSRLNKGDDKKEETKKTTKSSGVAERAVRRGRPRAAKAKEAAPEKAPDEKPAARRRSSSRRAAKVAEDKIAAAAKKPAAKKAAAPPKAAAKKEAKAKRGGAKRSSSDGNGTKAQGGRAAKRARKSAEPADKSRRTTRSRSRSTTTRRSTSRGRKAAGKVESRKFVPSAIVPAPSEGSVVPVDLGLQRESFDGQNFTYGVAHYDASQRDDPLMCKDYVADMFQQLYHAETTARSTPYMDRQDDINEKMRAILIDWLVEVHMKFRLVPETLYLCVHIIDRYCSLVDVQRTKLQLVGVTALFVACKHEEIYPPEVRDCVYITDRAYDRQEVLDMEQTILRVLNWKISLPTAYPFLDRFLGLTKASELTRYAAQYYMERTLQEHDLLKYRPSMVCAAAVTLALNNPDVAIQEEDYHREGPGLPKILMQYTGFDKEELMECMTLVAAKISEPSICASRRNLTAVKKKYEHRKYQSVSSAVDFPSVFYVKENMKGQSDEY